MKQKPLLSVRIICYNQEAFIEEALEGIFGQKTNFSYEVVIGDDLSTDTTLEKIKKYMVKYPDKINLLSRKIGDDYYYNRKKLGRLYNLLNVMENCQGKYIALLDGDDYWTDPYKLQKQIDFLEEHPDYALCFTDVNKLNQNTGKITNALIKNSYLSAKPMPEYFTYKDYFKNYFFSPTLTSVFRNHIDIKAIKPWFVKCGYGDLALWIYLSYTKGKVKVLSDVTGVYRKHNQGVFNQKNPFDKAKTHRDVLRITAKNLGFSKKDFYIHGYARQTLNMLYATPNKMIKIKLVLDLASFLLKKAYPKLSFEIIIFFIQKLLRLKSKPIIETLSKNLLPC